MSQPSNTFLEEEMVRCVTEWIEVPHWGHFASAGNTFKFSSQLLIMIRSPPPKATNRAPAKPVIDPPSRSSSSLDVSTPHPTGVTPSLTARSPRPEEARFAYLNAQLENLISERNAARKDAEVTKEEKNFALRGIRQQYAEEKQDWVESSDTSDP